MINKLLVTGLFIAVTVITARNGVSLLGDALDEPSLTAWLLVVEEVMRTFVVGAFALFMFLRPRSRKPSRDPIAWIACAAAIGAAMFMAQPADSATLWAVIVGELVVIAGVAFSLYSISFLGRCFGVLPEVRGLVTGGPYQAIRHPLYLGEITAYAGFVIASQRLLNVGLLVVFFAAQSVRMRLEEAALLEEFPDEYGEYAARTPRLIARLPRRRPAGASGALDAGAARA